MWLGLGSGHQLGREHDSTSQSGVEALRLLKRSLPRLYCCRCLLFVCFLVCGAWCLVFGVVVVLDVYVHSCVCNERNLWDQLVAGQLGVKTLGDLATPRPVSNTGISSGTPRNRSIDRAHFSLLQDKSLESRT